MLIPCLSKPETLYQNARAKLNQNKSSLLNSINQINIINRARLSELSAKLDALSPLKVLSRGYSLVTKDLKTVSASELDVDDQISIQFCDGNVNAKVTSKKGSD